MGFSIKINRKKLEAIAEVAQSLKQNVIDKQTATNVGVGVIDKMKSLIEKGISPIKGNGRFPAYKGVAGANEVADKNKLNVKDYSSKQGRFIAREHNKAAVSAARKNVYPYNVMDEYPDKKVRPVNLWLSGDFISSLDAKESPAKHGYVTEIFYKGKEDLKESGHRAQNPSRPTIPQGDEQFVVAIQRIITTIFKERIAFLLNKIRK